MVTVMVIMVTMSHGVQTEWNKTGNLPAVRQLGTQQLAEESAGLAINARRCIRMQHVALTACDRANSGANHPTADQG